VLFLLAEEVLAAFLGAAALLPADDAVPDFLLVVLAPVAFLAGAAAFLVVEEEAVLLFLLAPAVVPAAFLGAALFLVVEEEAEAVLLPADLVPVAAFLELLPADEDLPAPPVVEAVFLLVAINCEFKG